MTFSERLKELRESKGLSQRELAKELDTSQANIQRWENGKVDPTSNNLIKIALFFNVSVGFMVGVEN